jgi:hypothetical protein
MGRKTQAVKPANRVLLLLFALLLTFTLSFASISPAYGAEKDSAKKVKISKTKATITAGKTLTLKVSGTKAKVKWSSSNKKVATVTSKGKVKGIKAGKATIKATYKVNKKNKTLKCVVTVKAAPAPTPAPTPTPEPTPPAPPAQASFAQTTVALPAGDMDYKVNYVTISLPAGSAGYTFTLNGAAATPSPVFSDGTLLKIAAPAGASSATVAASKDGTAAGSATLSFGSAGEAAPMTIYGTIPMKFSEYFHDVTADGALPTGTSFPKSGAVTPPELFITQGTRTGNVVNGVDTITYAEAEAAGLPYVDAVSTATYGDTVHFAPDGNLSLNGNRLVNNEPNKAITGVAAAEVSAQFDLYANAAILSALGQSTAQSANVFAKLKSPSSGGKFLLTNVVKADGSVSDYTGATVATNAIAVYKPKPMLTDGNWGERTLVNPNAVKALPGEGNNGSSEDVAYGGNWGDKVTGFSFGTAADLGPEYSGGAYWDNFANYLYGGVITDSTGHSEPLVFLQNLFSHRGHLDFDVSLSPSRFSRLLNLKSPDTYQVTVFADGFEDITFSFGAKNFVNTSMAFASDTSVNATTAAVSLDIKRIDNASAFAAGAKIYKGGTEVDASKYSIVATGRSTAKLTMNQNANFFNGAYQGSYTLACEDDAKVSKSLTFTVVNPAAIKLALTPAGVDEKTGYSAATPMAITKAGSPKLYFVGTNSAETEVADYFASTLVTAGGRGVSVFSTIENTTDGTAAAAVGTALVRTAGNTSPYCIDIGSAAFAIGKTYKLTLIAPGFNNQVFYIEVTS